MSLFVTILFLSNLLKYLHVNSSYIYIASQPKTKNKVSIYIHIGKLPSRDITRKKTLYYLHFGISYTKLFIRQAHNVVVGFYIGV